jgi:hypothetical protein
MKHRHALLLILALTLALPAAAAQWYDHYFEGIDAAKKKDWPRVVAKMTDAIAMKPGEERRARTYGVQMIPYHPYYYRGVAHMNQGKWADAVEDLKRATGVGEVNLGDPSTLLITANQQLVAEQIRSAPPQQPATPAPTQPATPRPDPALAEARERAESAVQNARARLNRAQQADAPIHASADFDAASNLLRQSTSSLVNASSAADYRNVADLATRAARGFDAAISNAELRVSEIERQRQRAREQAQQPTPSQPSVQPPVPAPARATEDALSDTRERLRGALQAYFEGNFRASASELQQLSLDQPNNAMIFAFLGASRYYDFYLRGQSDPRLLEGAKEAFRHAKSLNPSLRLDADYFSPRLRGFFQQLD